MSFDLDKCRSKDELEAFALEMFGVDLDKRKKLNELKDEVRVLIAGKPSGSVSEDSGETTVTPEDNPPEYVKHHTTGSVFHYQPRLEKRLGIDFTSCTMDGKPV